MQCLKECIFQGTGSIKIRKFSPPSAATMVPPRVVTISFANGFLDWQNVLQRFVAATIEFQAIIF